MVDLTKLIVEIDTREPISTLELVKKIFPEAIQKQLPLGDIAYKNIVFELKTWGDFVASIKDDRFRNQLYNLTLNDIESYYIIYGDWGEIKQFSHIRMEPILAAMASIQARYNIKLSTYPRKDYAIYTICGIIKKSVDGKEIKPITHKTTTEDFALNMILSSAPRFSERAARNALERFGTVKNIINSDQKEFKNVKFIGKKISEEFFKTINFDFSGKEEELLNPEDLYPEEEIEELPEEETHQQLQLEHINVGTKNKAVVASYGEGEDFIPIEFNMFGACPNCKRENILYSDVINSCPICENLMTEDYFFSKFPLKKEQVESIHQLIPEKYETKKNTLYLVIQKYVKDKKQSLSLKKIISGMKINNYSENEIRQMLRDLELDSKIYQSTTDSYDVF